MSGGRHARVSPTPGRGSKIAYTPCPRSEPPQDLDLPVTARNCLAIPMSSLQTANGPGKGECKLISKLSGQRGLGGGVGWYFGAPFRYFWHAIVHSEKGPPLHLPLAIIEILRHRYCFISFSALLFSSLLSSSILLYFPIYFLFVCLLLLLALTCFVCCLMIAGRLLLSVSSCIFIRICLPLSLSLSRTSSQVAICMRI